MSNVYGTRYISLCSKLVYEGLRGVKNLQNPVYVVYERPQKEKKSEPDTTRRLFLLGMHVGISDKKWAQICLVDGAAFVYQLF